MYDGMDCDCHADDSAEITSAEKVSKDRELKEHDCRLSD